MSDSCIEMRINHLEQFQRTCRKVSKVLNCPVRKKCKAMVLSRAAAEAGDSNRFE